MIITLVIDEASLISLGSLKIQTNKNGKKKGDGLGRSKIPSGSRLRSGHVGIAERTGGRQENPWEG